MRSVVKKFVLAALVMAAGLFSTGRASAALMTFDSYLNLAPGAFVGSTTLVVSTPTHIHGTFDPATFSDFADIAQYPLISLTFDVSGVGVFSAATPSDSYILAISEFLFGFPAIGITDLGINAGYYGVYTTTATPYVYNALTPNTFSAADSLGTAFQPLPIALAGGAGDLLLFVDDSVPVTTVLANEVPEPSTSAIFAVFGAVALVGGVIRRRRGAASLAS